MLRALLLLALLTDEEIFLILLLAISVFRIASSAFAFKELAFTIPLSMFCAE